MSYSYHTELNADEIKFGFKNPSFSGVGTSKSLLNNRFSRDV